MARTAIFAGLVIDENDNAVEVAHVGDEAMYVVNDAGFRRHISSEIVDRQVFQFLTDQMKGKEDLIGEETAKMLGQDDPFSRAMILNQLKQMDQQFDHLLQTGIPEEGRTYLGMMGFRVVINIHGEVLRIDQPGAITGDEGDE
ncbi:MAG TPA: hypothetical protein VIO36_06090 [Anaerolineaceae bacterium]